MCDALLTVSLVPTVDPQTQRQAEEKIVEPFLSEEGRLGMITRHVGSVMDAIAKTEVTMTAPVVPRFSTF